MKRFICFFLLFAVLLLPAASAEPLRDGDISISAPSAILMEKYTGEVLYEKNAHERIFPAERDKGDDDAAHRRGHRERQAEA